jgi:uncharacterized protein (UPF0333 family)
MPKKKITFFRKTSFVKKRGKMEKSSQKEYTKEPIFWQYTLKKNVQKFVLPGMTKEKVVMKEILDNACDAAEKNGGGVDISLNGSTFSVRNLGIIPHEVLIETTNFINKISDKSRKYQYTRGSMGHGLKITIMMVITRKSPVIISSGGYRYFIELIDRKALDPKQVLKLTQFKQKRKDNMTEVVIKFENIDADENKSLSDYITSYILVNPHINFTFNGKSHPRLLDISEARLKRAKKVDISAYTYSEFKKFVEAYHSLSNEQFAALFNIGKKNFQNLITKLKENPLSWRSSIDCFHMLQEICMKLPQIILKKELLAKRLAAYGIEMHGYRFKKFNNGFAEIALISGNENIVSYNGSCIMDSRLKLSESKDGIWSTSIRYLTDSNNNQKHICLLYYCSKPDFRGANKETLFHNDHGLYTAIINLQKNNNPSDIQIKNNNDWLLLAPDKYDLERINDEAKLYHKQPRTFFFLLKAKEKTLEMYKRYGQITLRQLYYALVSSLLIENSDKSYDNFLRHLTDARKSGLIDYDCFEDRSRYMLRPMTVSYRTDVRQYAKESIETSLHPPELDLWENQPYHVELWIEKDALSTLFRDVAAAKQVSLFPSRGYTSQTKINENRQYFNKKIREGKKCVIIYFGDLDPSGNDIYSFIKKELETEDIILRRVGLNPDQVTNLLPMPVKDSDSRSKKFKNFMSEWGIEGCYELDAMDPDEMIRIANEAIDEYFDDRLVPKEEMQKWKQEFEIVVAEMLEKLSE